MALCSFNGNFLPISNMTISSAMAHNSNFRISTFAYAEGTMYIISSKGAPSHKWHLALTSAITVLECVVIGKWMSCQFR